MVARTLKLLDLYGEVILRTAVDALLDKESYDLGALAVLGDQKADRRHRVYLASSGLTFRIIMTSPATISEITMTIDVVALPRQVGLRASQEAFHGPLKHGYKTKMSPEALFDRRAPEHAVFPSFTFFATLSTLFPPVDRTIIGLVFDYERAIPQAGSSTGRLKNV